MSINYVGHIVVFRAPNPENKNFETGGFGKVNDLCYIPEHTKKEPCYILHVERPKHWPETDNIIHVQESQIKRILL